MKLGARKVLLLSCILFLVPFICNPAEKSTTILDKDMNSKGQPDIRYPLIALQTGTQGVVVVHVTLDDKGNVIQSLALSGNEILIAESLENAKKWRFDGNTQRAAIIVFNFEIPQRACLDGAYHSVATIRPPNFVNITGCMGSL